MSSPIDQAARTKAIERLDTTFLVEAAAGTGKTSLAIARILHAVRVGAATMEQIVAITFTEKAAGELKIRLRGKLEEARREATGDERTRFERAVRDLERSHIRTIHGFCSWLLHERPIEARVDPGFQTLDALQAKLLREETWQEWMHAQMEHPPEVLRRALFVEVGLNRLRDIAFAFVDRRALLDPGASAPGGRPVADGVAELEAILAPLRPKLANCIDPSDGAYQQITALLELAGRLKPMPPHRQEYELIHAVHVNRRSGAQKNWDDAESLKAIKAAYESLNAIPARRWDALLRDLAAWLRQFAAAFERAKTARGALDFDDLLLKTRDLLAGNRDVRAKYQREFRVLLVDEFQDTDPVQTEIAFFLAEQEAIASRWQEVKLQPGKLFLVGDPKQSIYRFRRADIEIYETAKQLVAAQGEVLAISQSFRTVSSLLTWVNFVFDQLIRPPDDGGRYQPAYGRLHEWPGHHSKTARLCLLEPTPEQRATIDEGARTDAVRALEAREVARWIEHAVASGDWQVKDRATGNERAARWGDVAILLHSPSTSLAAYEDALQRQGIPYQVEGGKDYFQSQEVRTVCALLLALDDPMNLRELVGVLRSAVFGCSDEDIFLWSREKPLQYQGAEGGVPGSVGEALGLLRRLHEQRNEHSFAGYLEWIYRELKLPELFSLKPHGHQRVSNLMKLIAVARRTQEAGLLSLREFVEYIRTTALDRSEEGQSPSAEEHDNVVRILSIHKAKGLEWGIVIIGDLGGKESSRPSLLLTGPGNAEAPPSFASIGLCLNQDAQTENYADLKEREELRERAEEKRLLYVAATRARDWLVLPWFAKQGHYLNVIRDVFNPAHPGETIPMFSRHDGSHSLRATTRAVETIRVSLEDPKPALRGRVEQMQARRVEWFAVRQAFQADANAGRVCLTPSGLAEEQKPPVGDATVGRAGEAERAARFGTIMHEVLSQMDFAKPDSIAFLWRSRADSARLPAEEIGRGDAMLRRFAGTELFGRIARAKKAHREMPFTLHKDGVILEGVMDLVFQEGEEWFLVDYKTDRVEKSQAEAHAARYRPQLDAYAVALQTIGGMRVAKILMFLEPGTAIELK